MKLDIVRAWKDEDYRQSLSDEQIDTLPANPAGELTSAELAAINGGQFASASFGGLGLGFSGFSGFIHRAEFQQSFAIECENNRFSFNFSENFNFLSDNDTICVNGN